MNVKKQGQLFPILAQQNQHSTTFKETRELLGELPLVPFIMNKVSKFFFLRTEEDTLILENLCL